MSNEYYPKPTLANPKPYAGGATATAAQLPQVAVFGNTSRDNVRYRIEGVSLGGLISADKWTEIESTIDQEIGRRLNQDTPANIGADTGILIQEIYYANLAETMNNFSALAAGFPGGAWSGVCNANVGNGHTGTTHCNQGRGAYVPNTVNVAVNDVIDDVIFNRLVNDINDSGNSCFCNCNYCACNCNFCTCNCNFGCVCNCNYSDEKTKENIEYL